QYYKELAAYHEQDVLHETAVRSAFQNLLAAFAPSVNWLLVPEETLANGKRPDGTLRDTFRLPRGYWEAKDTRDDLATEIRKKIAAGYPTSNIIFEDTRRALLYQNNRVALEADLGRRDDLLDLLRQFFSYTEPDIATFEAAVDEFRQRIPDLAQGLLARIDEEHSKNARFVKAFGVFLELCRASLDPQLNRAAVDEMLVQHLLTERLFRTVFNNPDFTRRNAIAAEIENVIAALTSRAFNRHEFERSLDRFYIAIEGAARTLDNWTEKQHFLDTVYERFFQGFSIKQADTHGIVYTPQEIVDFMVASVEEVLRRDFGVSLSTPGVQVLDPCVGTGNFIVNILRRISGAALAQKYASDLFCNEIMLLPYYIASLNIEHAYYERTGTYQPFEGICFADTLELAERQQMSLFVEENTERVKREKEAQIMVVIGNPPYNVGQKNENDNNKNRPYPVIDHRIHETYVKDSKATLTNKLYDAYVKFYRWATDRLQENDGIICFVSNNGFLDGIAFDGFRKWLATEFTHIYHIDLGGNARKHGGGNVFGIMVGVGITILVRHNIRKEVNHKPANIFYWKAPEPQNGTAKLLFLSKTASIAQIEWKELYPDEKYNWLTEGMEIDFPSFLPLGSKNAKTAKGETSETIFKLYSLGVVTNRDSYVYSFNPTELRDRVKTFIDIYDGVVDKLRRQGRTLDPTALIDTNDVRIKWTRQVKFSLSKLQYSQYDQAFMRTCLYRPFTKKNLYFDDFWNEERYQQPLIFPIPETENIAICIAGVGDRKGFGCLATNTIPSLDLAFEKAQCFPYYTYAEDGSNRRENITDWALAQFQARYGEQVTKRDIFYYVYALLHHPQYRERYAENLKRELPRLPLLDDGAACAACVDIGKRLMALHLGYEQAAEYPLRWIENPNAPVNWRVEKMRLSPAKTSLAVNDWLTLADIPAECYRYRLGNRSALEWIIDQYQVSTDKRSGITSDPNRLDDEQYIARLVGKVVTVSMETVKLVEELAGEVLFNFLEEHAQNPPE
ncbi:MAG TPA: type ISP restriction/modification enzyme, partial [Ktedonobacteraceae bacterium]|nr:type ISP restriction/modification enzyme [Ktedonobacteraceae bacterium]